MVLEKKYIIEEIVKNDIQITGALHIGAHECEEIPFYNSIGLKLEDIIWIEANPTKVEEAKKYVKSHLLQSPNDGFRTSGKMVFRFPRPMGKDVDIPIDVQSFKQYL